MDPDASRHRMMSRLRCSGRMVRQLGRPCRRDHSRGHQQLPAASAATVSQRRWRRTAAWYSGSSVSRSAVGHGPPYGSAAPVTPPEPPSTSPRQGGALPESSTRRSVPCPDHLPGSFRRGGNRVSGGSAVPRPRLGVPGFRAEFRRIQGADGRRGRRNAVPMEFGQGHPAERQSPAMSRTKLLTSRLSS